MQENIILIGFMGVGKGRTARALSSLLGTVALDTDDLIESWQKQKIRSIFSSQGEEAFRQMEQKAAAWLEQQVRGTIVSTGGGFFMVPNIRQLGTVVYLHSDVESILQAILAHPKGAKKIKKRPLLQDLDKAKELFDHRLPLYRAAAHHEVVVTGRSEADIAQEIAATLL